MITIVFDSGNDESLPDRRSVPIDGDSITCRMRDPHGIGKRVGPAYRLASIENSLERMDLDCIWAR